MEMENKFNFDIINYKVEVIGNGNLKNSNSNNKLSIWKKTTKTILDYLNFLKIFLKKKVNIIEILYIIRPFIYLSLMVGLKKNSFIPLLVNLIFDVIILKTTRKDEQFDQQKAYSAEYMHRLGRLSVYFLREPIFSTITKPFIRKLMEMLRIPDFISNLVMLLLAYYTNVYFIL